MKSRWNHFLHFLKENHSRSLLEIAKNSTYSFDDLGRGGFLTTALRLVIKVNRVVYMQLKEDVKLFSELAEEFFSGELDIHNQIDEVFVVPFYETFVDWDALSGLESKSDFIAKVKEEREILISIVLGSPTQSEKDYANFLKYLIDCSKKLGHEYPHKYFTFKEIENESDILYRNQLSLEDQVYHFQEIYKNYLNILEESHDVGGLIISNYEPTGWAAIDKDLKLMFSVYHTSKDRIEYGGVGNMLRSILIKVANLVYDSEKHELQDQTKVISENDVKGMLDGYFSTKYKGNSFEEYRNFTKSLVALTNKLTHGKTVEKHQLAMGVDACFFLVRMIELTEKNVK